MEAAEALHLLEEFEAARNQWIDAKGQKRLQHGVSAERVNQLADALGVEAAIRQVATKPFGDVARNWFYIDDPECGRAISHLRILLKAELATSGTASKPGRKRPNADRDAWIIAQNAEGKTYKEIRNGIPKQDATWSTLDSDQGVLAVLKRNNISA